MAQVLKCHPQELLRENLLFLFNTKIKLTFLLDSKHRLGEKLHSNISIFEKLYLFNWDTGDTYSLSNNLRSCIEKLEKRNNFTIDLFLSYFSLPRFSELIEIEINDQELLPPEHESRPQITVSPSGTRNNYLDLTIQLKDQNGEGLFAPEILKLITFDEDFDYLMDLK